MKVPGVLLLLPFALSASARAAPIPSDLAARAAELRKPASPRTLAWIHDQGVALAKARSPIDLSSLEQSIRLQFVSKRAPAGGRTPSAGGANLTVVGAIPGADIEALAFLVLMDAANSAQEDLQAVMAGVKAINNSKNALREDMQAANQLEHPTASATPTPAPDRVAQLVAAARSVEGKALGANLALLAPR
ncbi:MAG TPA: hypothetical protein VMN04_05180 [Thermoanaerobaculia bacterium]|nr:hypothetical protein [Thermoanaerobaculia bacterium]